MPVKLTLDIFSGRPNPEMTLDDATARDLFKRLSFSALKKQTEKTPPFPSVLGYRGLIIEQQGKKLNAGIPELLHYAHDTVYADGNAAKAEGGLESFLFDNANCSATMSYPLSSQFFLKILKVFADGSNAKTVAEGFNAFAISAYTPVLAPMSNITFDF